MTVGKCILGMSTAANQNSEIWITDGSTLTCTNYISFSDANVANSSSLSGNKIVVSNENSRLVAEKTTYMDRTQSSYNGGVGGNHLIVTDNARADLKTFNIATSGAHSMSNRVTVSKGGVLTMTQLNLGSDWYSKNRGDYTTIEVLDGGVVTNTGALMWGYSNGGINEHHSSTLFVSNGTFISKANPASSKPRIAVGKCTVRLSGPRTKFQFSDTYDYGCPFFASSPGGNKIILENYVTNNLPIRYGFSYTKTSTNNTIIVRTGACLDQGSSSGRDVYMAGFNSGKGPNGYCNKILVESGASIRCWSFYANSVNGFVGISNATVTCVSGWYYNEHLGFSLGGALNAYGNLRSNGYGHGTNMVLALSGTTPKIRLTGSRLGVDPSSKIRFDLPSEGYPETAQPLIDVPGTMFFFDPGCVIEFTGTTEMLAYHKDVLKRSRRYKLVQATDIMNIDDVMASAQARLPEGLTLEKKTEGKYTQLWLRVRPQLGMTLIFR